MDDKPVTATHAADCMPVACTCGAMYRYDGKPGPRQFMPVAEALAAGWTEQDGYLAPPVEHPE